MIKTLINELIQAIVFLLSGIILGSLIPFGLCLVIAISTDYTLYSTVFESPFWFFEFVGVLIAYTYLHSKLNPEK